MSDLFGNHIVGFPTRRLISRNNIDQGKTMTYPDMLNDKSIDMT